MYTKPGYLFLIGLLFAGLLTIEIGCTGDGKTNEDTLLNGTNNTGGSIIKIEDRLFSVPSPIQIAQLVRETDLPFTPELLNPTSNSSHYATSYKQALNLGVYGANLGYLNIYDQLPDAAQYFAVVKMLGNELGITSTFDKETIQRVEDNMNNRDSLIYIISTLYRDVDAFLLNNDRNEVGILVLAGGWIESLYFLTRSLETNNDKKIINRIGEQKYPLENLIELLRPYYNTQSDDFDELLEKLIELASIFDGVVIEYEYETPVVDAQKKLTIIKSKSQSVISDYQIREISRVIQEIRADIIN